MRYRLFRPVPISTTSWWQNELVEKKAMLELFWKERVVKLNQESVDGFKNALIAYCAPDDATRAKFEKLFSDAAALEIGFPQFFEMLKYIPMIHIRGMAEYEKLPIESRDFIDRETVTPVDLANVERYMHERHVKGAVSFGFSDQAIFTLENEASSAQCFAMQSVGKVFTGVLTLMMVKDGVIPESYLNQPLDLDFVNGLALPESIKEHLISNQVTLHQLMTHHAGLGDYLKQYTSAVQRGECGDLVNPHEFLQFADEAVTQVGKEKYSNLGILLAGLAVEHAYSKMYGETEYNDILKKYIIDAVGMPSFSITMPDNAQSNPNNPAPNLSGSPAGGYWVTAPDLARFGTWLYEQCKNDQALKGLIENYGQEFYSQKFECVHHAGGLPTDSAYLFVSLKTGAVVSALSTQPDMALELNSVIGANVFMEQKPQAEEDLTSGMRM